MASRGNPQSKTKIDGYFASLVNPVDCHESRCDSRNDDNICHSEGAKRPKNLKQNRDSSLRTLCAAYHKDKLSKDESINSKVIGLKQNPTAYKLETQEIYVNECLHFTNARNLCGSIKSVATKC